MESNKQRAKNDLSMNPIADKSAAKMINIKGASQPFSMQMAKTKETLPMKSYAPLANKQGYNSRLDESLGARNGDNSQSMKARRDESKGEKTSMGDPAYSANKNSSPAGMMKDKSVIFNKSESPFMKSEQKVEQDYARNAIADYKAGDKKAGNYEKKKALETAAGEGK